MSCGTDWKVEDIWLSNQFFNGEEDEYKWGATYWIVIEVPNPNTGPWRPWLLDIMELSLNKFKSFLILSSLTILPVFQRWSSWSDRAQTESSKTQSRLKWLADSQEYSCIYRVVQKSSFTFKFSCPVSAHWPTEIGKKAWLCCLLSYSQAEPGRELTQPSPRLLAELCRHFLHPRITPRTCPESCLEFWHRCLNLGVP